MEVIAVHLILGALEGAVSFESASSRAHLL
jgi:hypothetical protein